MLLVRSEPLLYGSSNPITYNLVSDPATNNLVSDPATYKQPDANSCCAGESEARCHSQLNRRSQCTSIVCAGTREAGVPEGSGSCSQSAIRQGRVCAV